MNLRACSLALGVVATLGACAPAARSPEPFAVHDVTPIALLDLRASDPSVAANGSGRVVVTYVTKDSMGAGDVWVIVSSDSGAHFAAPVRLNPEPGRVASYAESRPVITLGGSGQVVVAWAATREPGGEASDVVARASADGGATFGPLAALNDDHANPASGYHGFTAIGMLPDGRPVAAWLDGRASAGTPGEPARAEIYAAVSPDGGQSWSPNVRVAGDVCACCRLALAADARGHVAIAYRGAANDLRDPRLAVSTDGAATFALDTLISADRWLLPGCPSVGPAIAWTQGGAGQLAWFTGAGEPGVYLTSWRESSGPAGMKRALADSLRSPSRPMLAPLGGSTLVGVVAKAASDTTRRVLAVRVLGPDGAWSPWALLGEQARSAAIAGASARTAYAAWVESGEAGPRLRLARLTRAVR